MATLDGHPARVQTAILCHTFLCVAQGNQSMRNSSIVHIVTWIAVINVDRGRIGSRSRTPARRLDAPPRKVGSFRRTFGSDRFVSHGLPMSVKRQRTLFSSREKNRELAYPCRRVSVYLYACEGLSLRNRVSTGSTSTFSPVPSIMIHSLPWKEQSREERNDLSLWLRNLPLYVLSIQIENGDLKPCPQAHEDWPFDPTLFSAKR